MPQKKSAQTKRKKKRPADPESETENDMADIGDIKSKKTIDIESALEPAAIIADEEVLPTVEESEDGNVDELSLDDDELNPFGDKWEQ